MFYDIPNSDAGALTRHVTLLLPDLDRFLRRQRPSTGPDYYFSLRRFCSNGINWPFSLPRSSRSLLWRQIKSKSHYSQDHDLDQDNEFATFITFNLRTLKMVPNTVWIPETLTYSHLIVDTRSLGWPFFTSVGTMRSHRTTRVLVFEAFPWHSLFSDILIGQMDFEDWEK